ncbi:hypothetical protein FACS1894160_3050 [Bacteroidia bacterium]|nr:hypothetical protein FACS1894160_3050 [Bacteroidia bacterium]
MIEPDAMDSSLLLLFDLLKSSLRGTKPDEKLFVGLDETAWNGVFKQASKQGVAAVAFDGVMLLPSALQPPRKLKIAWGVKVDLVENNFTTRQTIAEELTELFEKNNIRVLIFKGLSLAQYYQVPSHREFGDLDIYLYGQKKKGDQLLRQWGAQEDKKQYSDKHSTFSYKVVSVENHAYFLDIRISKSLKELNARLKTMAEAELKNAPDGKLLFPSPDFTALLFMTHAISNFIEDVPVWRHFYDWAAFLHANKGKWDMSRYCEALSEAGLQEIAGVFTSIAVDYLELPLDEAPPFERNNALEEKILTTMFHPRPPLPEKDRHSFLKIIVYKYLCFTDMRGRCNLIYSGAFRKMILNAVLYHIRYPEVTWKLNEE